MSSETTDYAKSMCNVHVSLKIAVLKKLIADLK